MHALFCVEGIHARHCLLQLTAGAPSSLALGRKQGRPAARRPSPFEKRAAFFFPRLSLVVPAWADYCALILHAG
jgi:hypothetical protein